MPMARNIMDMEEILGMIPMMVTLSSMGFYSQITLQLQVSLSTRNASSLSRYWD
jgi:hypothetical protein